MVCEVGIMMYCWRNIKSYDHVGVPRCCHVNTQVQGDKHTHVILNCSLHVRVLVHNSAQLWNF